MSSKKLTPNAQEVMIHRYALRDDQGNPKETVKDILARTARVVAQAEHNYRDGSTPQEIEKKFFELLSEFRFMPNGRTLANAGTGWGQLANCFVLPIKDDMGRTPEGIFNTLRDAVLVLQSGGGVGFSFGQVRPKGDSIKSSKGKATGVVSFLKVYDTAFWVIGQGGGRRSACMAVLPVHHPDIREFIHCKEREGVIEHFNISVGITDTFMEAVEKDTDFPLINPRNGEVWEKVKARELFHDIVHFAHNNGEPGVLYLDAANRENPTPSQGELEATNPCVTENTLVQTNRGAVYINELIYKMRGGNKTWALTHTGNYELITGFSRNGKKQVYKLTVAGSQICATADHKFYSNGQFVELQHLKIGDVITYRETEDSNFEQKEILSIKNDGIQEVYDICVERDHSFIGNGFVVHNCGEQYLLPYENCCMASINLAEHLKEDTKKKGLFPHSVDWEKLAETIELIVRWLDDVVDANKYVSAVPALEEAAKRNRRIGVSIMGLADMLYAVGVRYGSRQGIDFSGQVMEFIRFHTLRASNILAKERGAFPGIKGSRYDYSDANLLFLKAKNIKPFSQPKPLHEYKHTFGMPKLDWGSLEKDIKTYGVRNSCQNTIQPTGAIATISGLEGYGCEPVFALSYVMRTHEGAEKLGQEFRELSYESRLFREALERAGVEKKQRDLIFEEVRHHGTCQDVEGVPKEVREVFVVSGDVPVDEHVEMEAALQRFVDNAISKTINFPAEATEDEVWKAYLRGWKLGLKGMTVYVTGSRSKVVLETGDTQKKREEEGRTFSNEAFVGSPLVKVKPGDELCPECNTTLVIQEGCFVCPSCAYSKCSM